MSGISFDSSSTKSEFSVRIVVCDHYLTKPIPEIDVNYSEFRGSAIKQVPILRVFGPTPDGRKACLHIHGVFPYFYLPCPINNPEPQFLYQMAASLDKALNIALKQATSSYQHVYRISLVKGLPFYGFHDKEHLYLKVFLYNPGLIKQAVELCSHGAILGQTFQPHESHLNFTLQFFIDFNLFGMSNIDLQYVKFRKKVASQNSSSIIESPEEFALKSESMCYYEGDCSASHIINRQRVGRGDGIENPGLEEVWNQEHERRKQLNMSMASKSLTQARIHTETDSHVKFEQMVQLKLSDLVDKPVIINKEHTDSIKVNYPAESVEGSQLLSAIDLSIHLPNSKGYVTQNSLRSLDETLTDDLDKTLVDENLALNCSLPLHYSQVVLDNEDMDLINMLQDMEEDHVEEDSILATPADDGDDDDEKENAESDDPEYSQIFHEDTIFLEPSTSENKSNSESQLWNDSFWDGASIPQLDGTFDDDHVKKVRKRKMRPLKVGLSRPKRKESELKNKTENHVEDINSSRNEDEHNVNILKNSSDKINKDQPIDIIKKEEHKNESLIRKLEGQNKGIFGESSKSTSIQTKLSPKTILKTDIANVDNIEQDTSDSDEINTSQDTINSVTGAFLRKPIKPEPISFKENHSIVDENIKKEQNMSITELVEKNSVGLTNVKEEKTSVKLTKHEDFEPQAGPSRIEANTKTDDDLFNTLDYSSPNDSLESSPDEKKQGFISFYDKSRIFDSTVHQEFFDDDDDDSCSSVINDNKSDDLSTSLKNSETKAQDIKIESELYPTLSSDEDIKLYFSDMISNTNDNENFTPKILTPKFRAPTTSYIKSTLEKYKIPSQVNSKPYYSNHKDVGDKVEIGQMVLKVTSKKAKDQKPFEKVLDTTTIEEWRQLHFIQTNDEEESTKPENLINLLASNKDCILVPVKKPPTKKDVINWLEEKYAKDASIVANQATQQESTMNNIDDLESSQVLGLNDNEIDSSISLECEKDKSHVNNSLQITMQPDGSFLCFGSGQTDKETPDFPIAETDFLTIMLLEVHTSIRAHFKPNPTLDPIQAVFITITNDCPERHFLQKSILEIIVADELPQPKYLDRCINQNVTYVKNESEILEKIIDIVKQHDPDILCGYEIEMNSWGYILDRAQVLGLEMVQEISRITEKNRQKRWRSEENNYEGRILGRIIFNVWRLFRHELALSSYSFENCMYEVLKERVPKYSHVQLAEWWNDESRTLRWITVEHYLTRLSGTVRMLEKLDMINRTSELARLFGLQWWEVLSRGSQFRVESLMLRAARPLNLIALSPSVAQRAAMKAPECLPLIFEPESRFYSDPVIVLDFQSLYPSMMIAYNYCFSTCIGRVQNINGDSSYEFGAWRLRIPRSKLEHLVRDGLVHWSPVGVGFVKSTVRRGVLPALLRRILAARLAVKKGMKMQTDEAVKKAMHSRQLGLKLIANVTYGYTAANFSGRMPCVEVGDSVVAKGRETLQRAITLVENNTLWNAKVVYGDTDSMFVLIPGGSRQDAFRIGQEIADAVTADNPAPVKLKLEKVYQPCILQTKKRYVGYMYESADQETPVFEAKGIETVRRDGCPFAVKLLHRSLCELFSTGDVSGVKRVVTSSLSRLVEGGVAPMELFFTREYHGPHGYRPGAAAPPNEIAKRLLSSDPRAAPRSGERVSWLVSAGPPGLPLVRSARSPTQLLAEPHLRPHLSYYVTRVVLPPLHRCLSLIGVNVFKWWNDLGYVREVQNTAFTSTTGSIARYLWRERCTVCSGKSTRSVCNSCAAQPQRAVAALAVQCNVATTHVGYCEKICASCSGHAYSAECQNTECPVIWRRVAARQRLQHLHDIIRQTPPHLRSTETWDF